MNKQINDTDCLKLWQELNRKFNNLIDGSPAPAKVSKALNELRQEVISKNTLNGRQTESLTAKIDNYLKNEYGNTKTAENFGHSKPSK